jgi:hypothetical protein
MPPANKEALGIAMPTTGFRRFMFFNRFTVEREQGFVRIAFGNVDKANVLFDSYATVISETELASLKPTTMAYLGAQGTLLDEPPLWQPTAPTATEVANHFVMARHGSVAETGFYCFSFWSAVQATQRAVARDPKSPKNSQSDLDLIAEPMALLRSPLAAQQHLIRLLFPASEPSLLKNG